MAKLTTTCLCAASSPRNLTSGGEYDGMSVRAVQQDRSGPSTRCGKPGHSCHKSVLGQRVLGMMPVVAIWPPTLTSQLRILQLDASRFSPEYSACRRMADGMIDTSEVVDTLELSTACRQTAPPWDEAFYQDPCCSIRSRWTTSCPSTNISVSKGSPSPACSLAHNSYQTLNSQLSY